MYIKSFNAVRPKSHAVKTARVSRENEKQNEKNGRVRSGKRALETTLIQQVTVEKKTRPVAVQSSGLSKYILVGRGGSVYCLLFRGKNERLKHDVRTKIVL